jgi:hypothetical protein
MLGPFDWYSVLDIGIAAAVVVLLVLAGHVSTTPQIVHGGMAWGCRR